jgi:hypothetical protein
MKTFQKIEDNSKISKNINLYLSNIKIKKLKDKPFEYILEKILEKSEELKGYGVITCYLLASVIADNYNIKKSKIIIFHKKIWRALRILNIINIKKVKIQNIIFKFVELNDLINAFNSINLPYDKNIINENANIDTIEKYLFYWQSRI